MKSADNKGFSRTKTGFPLKIGVFQVFLGVFRRKSPFAVRNREALSDFPDFRQRPPKNRSGRRFPTGERRNPVADDDFPWGIRDFRQRTGKERSGRRKPTAGADFRRRREAVNYNKTFSS
jgi:hypothetical protein